MKNVSLFLVLVALAPSGLANCETGAYAIHTVAEYASLDGAPTWLFRARMRAGQLELAPVASETEAVVRRLHRLLSGVDAGSFAIEHAGVRCVPDASTARLARAEEQMDALVLRITPCGPPGVEDALAVYDRDTRVLRFPPVLALDRAPASGVAVAGELPALALAHGPRLQPGAPAITAADVTSAAVEETRVGNGGFAMSVVVLRLHHLERLFAAGNGAPDFGGGYLERSALGDRLGDFPVIFFRWPGAAPVYVGDGSWCAGYRFGMALERQDGGAVPAFDRFVLRRAWDSDGDELPDLLEVNGGDPGSPGDVLYALSADPAAPLRVVDYPQGC